MGIKIPQGSGDLFSKYIIIFRRSRLNYFPHASERCHTKKIVILYGAFFQVGVLAFTQVFPTGCITIRFLGKGLGPGEREVRTLAGERIKP